MITTEHFLIVWLPLLGFILTMMTLLWPISVLLRNASIVDPFWGMGFVITALYGCQKFGMPDEPIQIAVLILLALWGLRLSVYLFFRNLGKGEDPRYQAFRAKYGPERYGYVSLFQVFWLQGFIMWVVFLPVTAVWLKPATGFLLLPAVLGVLLWIVGFLIEAIGDWQLWRFKQNPSNKGRILDTGLWAWTRHPNYFGESLVWWGFGMIATGLGLWFALISPLLMTWLLVRVSGVKMTEEKLLRERPEYVDYVKRVPAFLPRKPG